MQYKIYLPVLAIVFSASSITANASSGDKKIKAAAAAGLSQDQKETRMTEMKLRVEEIKKADRSQLSSEERRDIREELRSMNKEAKSMGHGGVYISIAGILIIILVLILIL